MRRVETAAFIWAVAAAAAVGLGAAGTASAEPSADDHNCFTEPYLASCQGGPFGIPTSPADPQCAMSPADAVCGGGPYVPPAPPAVGSGLPGSINADGTAAGSPPPPDMGGVGGMGGIGGMPGMI